MIMAKINSDPDINATAHSKSVVEITTVYNNRFIRKLYVGPPYTKSIKKFEQDLKKGKIT